MAGARNILLVEDDPDIREAVAEVAEDAGYEVTRAIDGVAALQLLDAGLRPRAILLDLTMPRMDGATFLCEMRQRPDVAGTPVVVLTAAAQLPPGAKVDAVIHKPFTIEQLEQVLDDVAGVARATRDA